jgi:hypothetical protein
MTGQGAEELSIGAVGGKATTGSEVALELSQGEVAVATATLETATADVDRRNHPVGGVLLALGDNGHRGDAEECCGVSRSAEGYRRVVWPAEDVLGVLGSVGDGQENRKATSAP